MYKRLNAIAGRTVTLTFEGAELKVPAGESVAAAILAANPGYTRTTPVTGAQRAPYCMMGACFDCLMEIDGVADRQACMVQVRDGMAVRRQHGKRGLGE